MSSRKRPVDLCEVCRQPCRSGHHYCSDHRDPRPLPRGEEILRWIEAQACPLCRDGRTFKVLANHTVKAHGITGDDIREAAGLGYEARICSPEFTEDHRERMAGNLSGLENLRLGGVAASDSTGARMRAYARLAAMHPKDYGRLLASELTRDQPPSEVE